MKHDSEEISAFDLVLPKLREQIKKEFIIPTQIQQKAIFEILNKKNVLLIAPTGTGKTEAAIFPVFNLFLKLKNENNRVQGISVLYVTPLRALNRDIFQRIVDFGKKLEINVEIRHGDTKTSIRRKQALHPPDMLISTPETLQAILPGKRIREHLRTIQWVIVDEIHEIHPQLLNDKMRNPRIRMILELLLEMKKLTIS